MAHLWPAVSSIHTDLLQAWADTVEEESNGRIAVDIYPAATLVAPNGQYESVVNGISDMASTVLGYTANRFPLAQVVEVPGLVDTAEQGSCVVQAMWDEGLFGDEFDDTHPLFFFTHGPGLIHTTETAVAVPSDLAGLRIRRPTTLVGSMLEQVGAQPVGMPAPESYQAVQRGVIDGVALPWEGALVFRLLELTEHHTAPGGLYSLAFVTTMSQRVYDSLDDELKAVIDNNSGAAWAEKAGEAFDQLDAAGLEAAEEAGHEIVQIEEGDSDWQPVLDETTETYLSELEDQGLAARDVYSRAQELAERCS